VVRRLNGFTAREWTAAPLNPTPQPPNNIFCGKNIHAQIGCCGTSLYERIGTNQEENIIIGTETTGDLYRKMGENSRRGARTEAAGVGARVAEQEERQGEEEDSYRREGCVVVVVLGLAVAACAPPL
jgi:hypothetical protein